MKEGKPIKEKDDIILQKSVRNYMDITEELSNNIRKND